jgi:hypothetical protein
MRSITAWLLLASAHQEPVPSQVTAAGSCAQVTRPGIDAAGNTQWGKRGFETETNACCWQLQLTGRIAGASFPFLATPRTKNHVLVTNFIEPPRLCLPGERIAAENGSAGWGAAGLDRRGSAGDAVKLARRKWCERGMTTEEKWSGRADLNCRPLAPQASALPG